MNGIVAEDVELPVRWQNIVVLASKGISQTHQLSVRRWEGNIQKRRVPYEYAVSLKLLTVVVNNGFATITKWREVNISLSSTWWHHRVLGERR